MMNKQLTLLLACSFLLLSCDDTSPSPSARACDADPVVLKTTDGVPFVRTPDACFESLPDWPYEAKYVEIDGLRQAYIDEGPADAPVVLLLHGQPSWSYLYRKMIPTLRDAGYRVIAMDHLGMGRSDKPIDIGAYTYLGHVDRAERFIAALELQDINLFVQDWGSLIGLHVVGQQPDRFARVAVGNGTLPDVPANVTPFPPIESPDEIEDLELAMLSIPAQQTAFFDGCARPEGDDGFGEWMNFAMKSSTFKPSEVIEALTWFDLPDDEAAAYDAPFPSRAYLTGARTFPSLVNQLPGVNAEAWASLQRFEKPFTTIWAKNDPGNLGRCETQERLIANIPGAAGQAHRRIDEASHFLQDDQGELIATSLVAFFSERLSPITRASRYCEILLVDNDGGALSVDVWGTQNLNDCPAASWEALDAEVIQAERDAVAVIMNGPRLWLTDAIVGGGSGSSELTTFGDLQMRLLAQVDVTGGQANGPYSPNSVLRTTTYVFTAGEEVYLLHDPDGASYVMQSLSQIVDASLGPADLAALGERLSLPEGWTFEARTLDAPLIARAEGVATVVQDELENSYQRLGAVDDGPGGSLPVLDDGTGASCSADEECAGNDASLCLAGDNGGFCTVEGCAFGGCGEPYVCCGGCNPEASAFLPFDGSACLPPNASEQLSALGCTCE